VARRAVEDLGGPDNISAQKETIIDLACPSRLILHSVDTWLFEQESLVYKSKKRLATLLPVVVQRQQLADGLAKYMGMLGLERKHRVQTLQEILNESAGNEQPANETSPESTEAPEAEVNAEPATEPQPQIVIIIGNENDDEDDPDTSGNRVDQSTPSKEDW